VPEEDVAGSDSSSLFGKTVNCDEAIHQLYHYLDGELTEDKRRDIADHLNFCGPCTGAAGFEAELRQVIANRCKDHVPESLMQRIADAIDEESRQHNVDH
jgi:mycothiol system anti-sigma-R factor